MTEQELPFYDLVLLNAYEDDTIEESEKEAVKIIVANLVDVLQDAINKPNFWKGRESEIRKLQGEIDDLLDFSGIEALSSIHVKLSTEILNLAKRRHQELIEE